MLDRITFQARPIGSRDSRDRGDVGRREMLRLGAAILATGGAFPACAEVPLKFGLYSKTIFSLPLWIAQEKGFFKALGIALTLNSNQTIQQTDAALLDGSEPIAMLGPEVAFTHPAEVCVIAGNANRPPHFIIAQPRFKTLADLRGATFGVISETEGTTNLVRRIMAAAGLTPTDYSVAVAGSAPERVRLLEAGKIDAALQPFPLSYEAEAKGFSNLGWVGKYEPDWQFTALLANRSWLAAHHRTAVDVLRALVRGRRYMDRHRDETTQIVTRRMETSATLAARALDDCMRLRIIDADLRWSEAGLAEIYKTLQRSKDISPTAIFDLKRFSDPRPLQEALQAERLRGR